MNRRNFVSSCLTCSAHVYGIAQFAPSLIKKAFFPVRQEKIVAKEDWGMIEKLSDGIWCLVSTPFESRNFTTVCNGGIVAGDKGVLAVESFMQPKGATWLAKRAKELTGRWPTDIVSTHYHADHTAGHKGYFVDGQKPKMWLTDSTRKSAEESFAKQNMDENSFMNVANIGQKETTVIDLGNRKVNLVNRSGHTNSDITIEVVDPKIVFCGDLFFNRMFPNYGDAIPSKLEQYADSIATAKDITYVPGHGPVADADAIKSYKELLIHVKESATTAFNKGLKAEESAKEFKLPKSLANWTIWSPDNALRAYNAWYKELKTR